MQKGFAQPLVIVLIVAALSVFAYFYSQKNFVHFVQIKPSVNNLPVINNLTKPVNNIQTFSNTKFSFEFKYAKDLVSKEDTEEEFNKRGGGNFRKNFKGYVVYEPGKFLGAAVVLGKDNNFDTNPFSLWIFDNPQDLSIDAWYKMYWYYPFVWGDFTYTGKFTLAPNTEATISGQMAKSGIIDYQPGKPKFVYLSKEKKMYLFRIIGESGDKILSTFKFTN